MLERELVQRFVDRLCDTVHYNVNVMNTDGVIIAARDQHRKGVYHRIAHEIVQRRKDAVVAQPGDDLPDGVLPGVNLPVVNDGQIIGVVGVTGDYRKVESVAYAIKMSLETMVQYELEKEHLNRRQDRKRRLAGALLYDEQTTRSELITLLERLGYNPQLPRVALLARAGAGEEELVSAIKRSPVHTRQDITLPTHDGAVVVFKVVNVIPDRMLARVVEQLDDYCKRLIDPPSTVNPGVVQWYCGSIQRDPEGYRDSFRHALWLAENAVRVHSNPLYFFDYSMEFALSLVPTGALASAFLPFSQLLWEPDCGVYMRTFQALSDSNMSLKGAASLLGVHRNTVVLRLQRMRELFGLDPVNQSRDRRLLELILNNPGSAGPASTVHGAQSRAPELLK